MPHQLSEFLKLLSPSPANAPCRSPPAPPPPLLAAADNGPTDSRAHSTLRSSVAPLRKLTPSPPGSAPPAPRTVPECTAPDRPSPSRSTRTAVALVPLRSATATPPAAFPDSSQCFPAAAQNGPAAVSSCLLQTGPCCTPPIRANPLCHAPSTVLSQPLRPHSEGRIAQPLCRGALNFQ